MATRNTSKNEERPKLTREQRVAAVREKREANLSPAMKALVAARQAVREERRAARRAQRQADRENTVRETTELTLREACAAELSALATRVAAGEVTEVRVHYAERLGLLNVGNRRIRAAKPA